MIALWLVAAFAAGWIVPLVVHLSLRRQLKALERKAEVNRQALITYAYLMWRIGRLTQAQLDDFLRTFTSPF